MTARRGRGKAHTGRGIWMFDREATERCSGAAAIRKDRIDTVGKAEEECLGELGDRKANFYFVAQRLVRAL